MIVIEEAFSHPKCASLRLIWPSKHRGCLFKFILFGLALTSRAVELDTWAWGISKSFCNFCVCGSEVVCSHYVYVT